MKKHFLAAASIATIGIAGLGAGVAHAATNNSAASNEPMSNLVNALSAKFNLNKSDVQQVFDEQKTKMEVDHEQSMKDKVAKLVTDGKITQTQADAINAKRAELEKTREANHDSFKSMTADQRKSAREKQKADLEAWAKQNNIDTQYLHLVVGGGRGHGGPGGMHGNMDSDTRRD